MRTIEQIAIKTHDIDRRIKTIGPMFPFSGQMLPQKVKPTKWIQDQVKAVHIYIHPDYMQAPIGSEFEVHLAFNYDIIPGRELELIHLVSGSSVQLRAGDSDEGLSHFGYHIPDTLPLLMELEWWHGRGFICTQVSHTFEHSNTSRRYMYAFIDTRLQIGAYTKIISRVQSGPASILSLVEEFSHVNTRHD